MCVLAARARERSGANVPSRRRNGAPPPSARDERRKTASRLRFHSKNAPPAKIQYVTAWLGTRILVAASQTKVGALQISPRRLGDRRPGRRSHRRAKKTRLKTHALFFSRANCSFVTRRRHLSREECHRRDTAFRLPWEHRTRRKPDGYAISFSSPRVLTGPEPRDGHHPRSALRVDALRRSGSPRADPDPSPRSRRRRDARGQSYAARFYRPI